MKTIYFKEPLDSFLVINGCKNVKKTIIKQQELKFFFPHHFNILNEK